MAPTFPEFSTLANGLRVVSLPMPWRQTVSLSVFIRTGSLHESRRLAGISHVVEHMAFKGTARRTCQQINLDAERLGAEVNAHTDKDHTAFHIEGLGSDLGRFVDQLADIVLNPSFPADELERERQVILHELAEVSEDPAAMAFQAFDKACYGDSHAAGRPVIGLRANIERFNRNDLLAYVRQQYGAEQVVVVAAGPVDPAGFARSVEAAFGAMSPGRSVLLAPPPWLGGLRQHRLAGSSQCQLVLGFEIPNLADDGHVTPLLAATMLGEGMSSPLLDELRERRGLAYHVACSADVLPQSGQFVIEAATSPEQAEELFAEVAQLLKTQAEQGPEPVALARARQQLHVRSLRGLEHPARRMEAAVQDLFTFGRLRGPEEWMDRVQAVSPARVQQVFADFLQQPAAVGLAGRVPTRLRAQAAALFKGLAA